MTTPSPESARDRAPDYVLGLLGAEEARAFEAELARSPELASLVTELRDVGVGLAASHAVAPPADLKRRVMARLHQAPPMKPSAPDIQPAVRRRWVVPGLVTALAAAVVAAVALDRQKAALEQELDRGRALLATVEQQLARREATLNTLLEAEQDLTLVHLAPSGPQAPGIQLYWNRRINQAVLHAFRLPPAPAGRTYQLWLIRDGTPIPSRTFNSDPDGHALVGGFELPSGARFEAAAVTVEPASGSATPTLPILLVGPVPGA